MRLWSTTGTLVVMCAALIVASELGEAMLLLPIILRRAAARRHLSEKLLNEINEIDFPNLSGQSIRRRSTTTDGSGDDDEDERPMSRGVASTTPQTDFSTPQPRPTAPANRTATTRKNENLVAPSLTELPKVDLFGDSDWPPRPRRQRNCKPKMMAGLSGMRILGKLAKCFNSGGNDVKQSETNWKLEGPIAEYGDFYLKQKPETQQFTAKFEKIIDEWLGKREKREKAKARANLVRT